MLVLATLLSVLDSVAKGVEIIEGAIGITGAEPNTVTLGANQNRSTLAALDDFSVQTDVTPVFAARAGLVSIASIYSALQGTMLQRALDVHYGAEGHGDLNRFLRNNDARVHVNLRKIGMQLDARNVFAPTAVDPVAQYDGTGAGTGTFTAGSDINTELYGEANMEVVVESMGADARTLRLTMKRFDGTTEDQDVPVPGNEVIGTAIAIGVAANKYVGVQNITTAGGGGLAGDAFHVRSKIERAIAL